MPWILGGLVGSLKNLGKGKSKRKGAVNQGCERRVEKGKGRRGILSHVSPAPMGTV